VEALAAGEVVGRCLLAIAMAKPARLFTRKR
jgi:hypothetical protein